MGSRRMGMWRVIPLGSDADISNDFACLNPYRSVL